MGGWVKAKGVEGCGATFRLYLPCEEPVPPATAPRESSSGAPGAKTILLVEDNDIVRDLTFRILKTLGYEVLQAHDGLAALDLGRNHPHPIHLVLTDMVMPRMDGKQLIESLRRHRQDFKVLFISGYNLTDTVEGRPLGSEVPLLQKPFTKEALTRKLEEVLNGP